MKTIYRGYADTEILTTTTHVKCPYCGTEWSEEETDECGKTYLIECGECEKEFKMYFDAD